jgi:glucose-1-phosphate cytidylyltransferase
MGDRSLPKPLAPIGGRAVLWHVMALYAGQGLNSFVLCLGHGGEQIRDAVQSFDQVRSGDWRVDAFDTGIETPTGGRLARVAERVAGGTFCLTYSDGLADLDLV